MILILGKSPNSRKKGFIGAKPLLELFWGDSMVDFLYRMNLGSYIEEKRERMAKSSIFWAEPASGTGTKSWYRYPLCKGEVVPVPLKVVSVPIDRSVLALVPVQVVPVPMLPTALFLHILHH